MRVFIKLDQQALIKNYNLLIKHCPKNLYLVVKSNAYGHGLNQIISMLSKYKIYGYVVSTIQEAITIRKSLIYNNVLLLTPYSNFDILNKFNIEVLTSSKSYTEKILNNPYKINVHAMIETGMHRDGITKELFLEFYKNNKFKKLLKGVCTHIYNVNKFQEQYEDFKEIFKEIKFNGLIHFKASSTIDIEDDISNSYRVGLKLYGLHKDYFPVLSMYSNIIRIEKVYNNDNVGYGENIINEDGYVYTIGFGYGDGWPKDLSFSVYINENELIKICPSCMDHSMFFSKQLFNEESIIEIIGEHNTVEKIALQNNMSIYEITTLLSPRINRIIKNKK